MPDISRIKNIERCVLFGTLNIEDLSPEDKENLKQYRQEKQKELSEKISCMEQEQLKRFINSVSGNLPTGSKNFKILGGNWFSFEFESNRYMAYYYYLPNSTTPIFTCMVKIS